MHTINTPESGFAPGAEGLAQMIEDVTYDAYAAFASILDAVHDPAVTPDATVVTRTAAEHGFAITPVWSQHLFQVELTATRRTGAGEAIITLVWQGNTAALSVTKIELSHAPQALATWSWTTYRQPPAIEAALWYQRGKSSPNSAHRPLLEYVAHQVVGVRELAGNMPGYAVRLDSALLHTGLGGLHEGTAEGGGDHIVVDHPGLEAEEPWVEFIFKVGANDPTVSLVAAESEFPGFNLGWYSIEWCPSTQEGDCQVCALSCGLHDPVAIADRLESWLGSQRLG